MRDLFFPVAMMIVASAGLIGVNSEESAKAKLKDALAEANGRAAYAEKLAAIPLPAPRTFCPERTIYKTINKCETETAHAPIDAQRFIGPSWIKTPPTVNDAARRACIPFVNEWRHSSPDASQAALDKVTRNCWYDKGVRWQ